MAGRGDTATVDAVRHALKERVLKLIEKSRDPAEKADFSKLLEWLVEDGVRPRRVTLMEFLQSPPFYFFFGLILLIAAFLTTYAQLNSSLNFLIAMLGVAVLLYGTGSQAAATLAANSGGAGGTAAQAKSEASTLLDAYLKEDPGKLTQAQLDELKKSVDRTPAPSGMTSAAANVAIAGGAAVLTAFFGWGVIEKSREIRQVFRDYDQYSLVRLEFCHVRDPECVGEGGGDLTRRAASPMSLAALEEMQRTAYLQTGLGRRAFGRLESDGLEFVVFDRDLGQSNLIRLVTDFQSDLGPRYTVGDDYFSIKSDSDCLSVESNGPCGYLREVQDAIDVDKVPRHVIRVVVNEVLPESRTVPIDDTGEGPVIVAQDSVTPR
jgi:hypothetical protein